MNLFRSLLVASILTAILNPLPSLAVQSIDVQTFNPSTSDHFVLIEDAFQSEWPKVAKFYFGANYNYVDEPLVALNAAGTEKAFDIVKQIQTLDLFFGFKPSPKLGLFFGAPIHFIGYPSFPQAGFKSGSATGFGDLKLMAKIRLTNDLSPVAVALIPEIHLPTGDTENFVSDASTYLAARLSIEHQFADWTFAANLGFATAPNSIYVDPSFSQGIDYRHRLMFGFGGFLPFNDQWGMNVEFNSIHMLPFDSSLNPNELYAGLRNAPSDNVVLTLGASLGRIGGPEGQNYRVIAGIRYTGYAEPSPAPLPVYTPAPMPSATPWPSPTPYSVIATPTPQPKAIMRARRIEILQPINFENNSARLVYDAKGVLDDVASLMKKHKRTFKKILVDGHTNKLGTDQHNLKLSIARALAVKNYLMSRGIPAKWMEARGFGERKPKVPYTDPNAMEINRRVEFIVVK